MEERQAWHGAFSTLNKDPAELTYFTHEVEGETHGGWFRVIGDSIEVLAKGRKRLTPLYGSAPHIEACSVLEGIVHEHAALNWSRKHK